ncbi:hypothetical protein ACFVVX_01195 [Kitasatospora sp. NPDC058170]|uniref:hypothetical protein n=1 Tax=Kitasatospora sp. NPDC058170 TaxID=3346364 RepID=UPI0036DEA600
MLALARRNTPTVTGRSYAHHIASLTVEVSRKMSGQWVAEARGKERRRRAAVCRIAWLTGTRAPQWSGEINEQDWRTVLAAGADALRERAAAKGTAIGYQLGALADEFAQQAAETKADQVVDHTRGGHAEAMVSDLLAGRRADAAARPVSNAEREAVERWSPFRGGPRYVCRSGRYGDGTPAPKH